MPTAAPFKFADMSTTSASKQFVFGDIGHCIAFGFGLGLIPRAPGTAGTLLAFPLYWLASLAAIEVQLALCAAIFALGFFLCGRTSAALNHKDDSGIVLDEIAAFYAVLLCIPEGAVWQVAAFILFRIVDARKPPPVNWLDRNIKGGAGIMIDDIAAAVITIVMVQTVAHIL